MPDLAVVPGLSNHAFWVMQMQESSTVLSGMILMKELGCVADRTASLHAARVEDNMTRNRLETKK